MNISIFDFSIYVKFFISLCALVNPIGMIPVFTSLTSHQTTIEKYKTNLIANCSAAGILFISLLLGQNILNIFGISINSFRIAGGVLIISIAYSMISGAFIDSIKSKKNNNIENISVVPLAMPLIAGPGAISSTIAWSTYHNSWMNIFGCSIVICTFSFVCWLCFQIAPCVVKVIGNTGINIITRIMGLLLMSLGIEFICAGVKSFF